MTMPTPYSTPRSRSWFRRDKASPTDTKRALPAAAALARPTVTARHGETLSSMLLTLDGAAGRHIAIYHLDKAIPYVLIDGVRIKRGYYGDFKIPMMEGRSQKLKLRAAWPGFPKVTFRGETLYRSPKPPLAFLFAFYAAIIGVGLFSAGLVNGAIGFLLALGTGYVVAAWMSKAKRKAIPLTVLIVGGLALGVAGLVRML